MKEKEVLELVKRADRGGVHVIPVHAFMLEFRDENEKSIYLQLKRMADRGVLLRLCPGFYADPDYVKYNEAKVTFELVYALRPADQFYLSLEERAFELGMILQVPNGFTFVTDGFTYTYHTAVGPIYFTHQDIKDITKEKGVKIDYGRGIYVATKNRVIKDATRHRRIGLLDLIWEQENREELERRMSEKILNKRDDIRI